MNIEKHPFGTTKDDQPVDIYTLTNDNSMSVKITNYGGIITSVVVPDKSGNPGDVVLGYKTLDGYLEKTPYFGAIVGRYGNRIGGAQFELDGVRYALAKNNGPNSLHGGLVGFDKKVWEAQAFQEDETLVLELRYLSPDMEEGFPGNLETTVRYSVSNENELRIDYRASTDKATHVNLTNHSYFNLKDGGQSPVLDHSLVLHADYITPVDKNLIPTGDILPVEGTPFDFRNPHTIGERIDSAHEQLIIGGGYDHNYVVAGEPGTLRPVARVTEENSGRVLDVLTTEPGVQFYTGNVLDGSIVGKGGAVYRKRHGFCLETQHYPDSPNKPQFPPTLLRPGDIYQSTTIFRFAVV